MGRFESYLKSVLGMVKERVEGLILRFPVCESAWKVMSLTKRWSWRIKFRMENY